MEEIFKKYLRKLGYGPMIDYDEDADNIFNPDARLTSVERHRVTIIFGFEDGSKYPISDMTLNRQSFNLCMDKEEVFKMIIEYLTK